MRVVVAGAIVVRQCEVGRVDACRVAGEIRHAVSPPGAMARAYVELALQGTHEGTEEIEEQAIRTEYDIAQLILPPGAENDGADALFLGRAVDPPDCLVRLVNARHKWQSYWSKFQAFKLRHETVAHGFRSHTRLVRNEKYGSAIHSARPARLLTETPVFHRCVAGASVVVLNRELTEERL